MSFNHGERNGLRNDSLNKENLTKDRGHVLRREELSLKDLELGVAVG